MHAFREGTRGVVVIIVRNRYMDTANWVKILDEALKSLEKVRIQLFLL